MSYAISPSFLQVTVYILTTMKDYYIIRRFVFFLRHS